ncbi:MULTISPECIES: histidine phosphatase family protein [Streptomyces]|uniref:histidine phosphatase family protein n=1 Tax=Streptomyces TaxID=1883 RepID=UPI000D516786|nr:MULTISPECIES: histidine phosphatase family protein [Streptomyces]NYS17553.1 histidine phosphatase family protein [Streptomyces sp. SJ1-7]PVC78920.1 histidine phosphatase family protein [Streptomyces sp. CS065A]
MTVRVMLVSPAMNAALRQARFDGDAPLDRAGERSARAAAAAVPRSDAVLSGPSERCLGTAAALGLAARPEPALTGWDLGRWSGRRLDEVGAAEPAAVAAWMGDPSAAPHGGESLRALVERVGGWLDGVLGTEKGGVLAVAEPAVVRAAVVHALALPPETFWRLDVAPLVLTELSGRSGRVNVRLGRPLAAPQPS